MIMQRKNVGKEVRDWGRGGYSDAERKNRDRGKMEN